MADDTLVFDGDEPVDHFNIEDNVNDADEDDYMEDAETLDDHADDDFKLDGSDQFGIPDDDEDEDEVDAKVTGQKRKRTSPKSRILPSSAMRTHFDKSEAFVLDEDDGFLNKHSSRVPGAFGRRDRRKGECLPAYHKRVTHELDSDDELMMKMREKGFSDRQIADKLAKDGRVRYDQKSISTRIMRIRLAQADNVDFLLREGYKEWEFEDDCLLMQAYALADIETNYEIERIRAWRFRKVSDYMRRLHKDALFSATACRERYNALIEGTARIPTDLDDDPDARRAEMEAYRESREQLRIKEQADKAAKNAHERKAKDEARFRNAQKAEEIANKRAETETKKAQRAMERAAQAQVRAQRSLENQAAKAQRNAQIKQQNDKHQAANKPNDKANTNVTLGLTNPKDVTPDTPDPRAYLSLADLAAMCADRGIPVRDKPKDELVQALRDADDEYSQNDLKKMCRSKGLDANASKVQMRYQLALAAAQVCSSFAAGVKAAAAKDDVLVDEAAAAAAK